MLTLLTEISDRFCFGQKLKQQRAGVWARLQQAGAEVGIGAWGWPVVAGAELDAWVVRASRENKQVLYIYIYMCVCIYIYIYILVLRVQG